MISFANNWHYRPQRPCNETILRAKRIFVDWTILWLASASIRRINNHSFDCENREITEHMQNGAFDLPTASTFSPVVSNSADTSKCSTRFPTGFAACQYGRWATITVATNNSQSAWFQSLETKCSTWRWRCSCGGGGSGRRNHCRRQKNRINNAIAADFTDDKCIFATICCKWFDAKRRKYCNNGTYFAFPLTKPIQLFYGLLFHIVRVHIF